MLFGLLVACGPAAPASVELAGALAPTDPHAAVFTLSAGDPADLRCVTEAGEDAHHLLDVTAPIVVRGLLADTSYRCIATRGDASSGTVELHTPALPDAFPVADVTVVGDPAEVGFHLVNLARLLPPENAGGDYFDDEFVAILDAEGRPRWHLGGEGGGDIDATWLGEGRLLFGGFGADTSTAPTILTLDGEVVLRAPDALSSAWQVPSSWHHDVGLAADGGSLWVLAEESIPTEDGTDTTWEGFVVQQLDPTTGAVTWSWSSMDDGVATGALSPGTRYDTGPYHANALWDVEEAGRQKLYVSLRNLNQVLRIDMLTRVVDLRIGHEGDLTLLGADGAPAPDAEWFFGQHDAKRIGDRLVVYDNGLGRTAVGGAPYSRAMVLLLDEAAGTARIETAWRGAEDWISPAWGGLDRRDDGALELAIGNFWWVDEDAPQRSALALLHPTATGAADLGWRIDFADRETALYRSDHIDGCALFELEDACPELGGR